MWHALNILIVKSWKLNTRLKIGSQFASSETGLFSGVCLVYCAIRIAHKSSTGASDFPTTSPKLVHKLKSSNEKKSLFKIYSQDLNFITQSLPAIHSKQTNLNMETWQLWFALRQKPWRDKGCRTKAVTICTTYITVKQSDGVKSSSIWKTKNKIPFSISEVISRVQPAFQVCMTEFNTYHI